jgi:hypothetical protein
METKKDCQKQGGVFRAGICFKPEPLNWKKQGRIVVESASKKKGVDFIIERNIGRPAEYILNVFDSGVKDTDKAYLESSEHRTLEAAQKDASTYIPDKLAVTWWDEKLTEKRRKEIMAKEKFPGWNQIRLEDSEDLLLGYYMKYK